MPFLITYSDGGGKRALFRQQQQFGMAHFRGRNFGALERMVFDDYNSSLYASKSTIVMDDWHLFFDFNTVRCNTVPLVDFAADQLIL